MIKVIFHQFVSAAEEEEGGRVGRMLPINPFRFGALCVRCANQNRKIMNNEKC